MVPVNTIVKSSQALNQGEKVIATWRVNGYPMHAEHDDRGWSIWVRNELAQSKYPAAWPLVNGCAVMNMRFTPPFLADTHYPEPWREAVRAKFLTLLVSVYRTGVHLGEPRRVRVTTLDTFRADDRVYNVELHDDTMIVVSCDGSAVARMLLTPDHDLGTAMPGDQASADSAWLDGIRDQALNCLRQRAEAGYGPWALAAR
jgi:hypothetical protein